MQSCSLRGLPRPARALTARAPSHSAAFGELGRRRSTHSSPCSSTRTLAGPNPVVRGGLPQLPKQRRRSTVAAAAATAPAAAAAAAAGFSFPALLHSLGVFVLCCAAAALLVAAIPVVLAAARAVHRAESVLKAIEAEIPDTAASMRLSGLELSDCLNELGALGGDITGGLRASARMLSAAETGIKAAPAVVANGVVPALGRAEATARGTLEGLLVERATSSPNLLPQVARGTAAAARRAAPLVGAGVTGFVAAAVGAGMALRGAVDARALQVARASVAAAGAANVEGGERPSSSGGSSRRVAAPRGGPASPPQDPLQRRQRAAPASNGDTAASSEPRPAAENGAKPPVLPQQSPNGRKPAKRSADAP